MKNHITLLSLACSLALFSTLSMAATVPSPQAIDQDIQQVYAKYKNLHDGKNADYIPNLAKVNPNYFAIAVITADGKIHSIGNASVPFAIESISKPFVYALALQDNGEDSVTKKIGLNATGYSFNSVMAIEKTQDHLQNPLVNAGAIQVTSLIKGKNSSEKWHRVLNLFKALSDDKPYLGYPVYQSEMATNQHNRAIATLLDSYNLMYSDPRDAVTRYTKDCSIMVTTKQLAMMGASLANGGVNPITHHIVLSKQYVRDALAEMTVNGLYENSGAWWWQVGVPAKSGVGGGIVAVVPHKMAIAVFSPPLDSAGNSVRAQKVIADLVKKWQLNLLN